MLCIYRSVGKDFTITDAEVKVPVLLIMGGKDYILKFQGMEDYVKSGKVKEVFPDLEITFLPEGTHFVQEQSPDVVNQLILTFLGKHVWSWKLQVWLLSCSMLKVWHEVLCVYF